MNVCREQVEESLDGVEIRHVPSGGLKSFRGRMFGWTREQKKRNKKSVGHMRCGKLSSTATNIMAEKIFYQLSPRKTRRRTLLQQQTLM